MPANSTHPEYDATAYAWLRARDILAGEDAVKAAGERYLPKLESQTDDEFKAIAPALRSSTQRPEPSTATAV